MTTPVPILAQPPLPAADTRLQGPPVPPQIRIAAYSDIEWERFIEEWVAALQSAYVCVRRFGGTGDEGVDVAGFKTEQGFEGAWDCYQCKHYDHPLGPAEAFAEILKVFVHASKGDYLLPDAYRYLAPQECGTKLTKLLSKPSRLKAEFLSAVDSNPGWVGGWTPQQVADAKSLAAVTDFSIFGSIPLREVLDLHASTRYHAARFGGPLPARPPIGLPPDVLDAREVRYVDQLVEVYVEAHPGVLFPRDSLASDPVVGDHFRRQRESFFSAEALRVYARDSVPEGTFEALQDDLHRGVVEVEQAPHPSGMDRLTDVLQAAIAVQLDRHRLIEQTGPGDRKGMCHQLANDDRLHWIGPLS